MKRRIFLTFALSLFCFSSELICEEDLEDEIEFDEEFLDDEDIFEHVNDEFDEFEEYDGVWTEETGPIPNSYWVNVAEGTIEEFHDYYTRQDSYFSDLDSHIGDDTVHAEEH